MKVVMGTRSSDLALVQAREVAARLHALGVEARLEVIHTQGDRQQHLPFHQMLGQGFFTREIEEALRIGRIDIAVHSLKDLPTQSPEDLCVAAICGREDPRDCLIMHPQAYDPAGAYVPLKPHARVGTSAVRRHAQLRYGRSDLKIEAIRGNLPTRIAQLTQGRCDAVVLAQAGLLRLGLDISRFHKEALAPDVFIPAPGQGALAVQVRSDNKPFLKRVASLADPVSTLCVGAERTLLSRLEGGCHLPLGAYACLTKEAGDPHRLMLRAFLGDTNHPERSQRVVVYGSDPWQAADRAFEALCPA